MNIDSFEVNISNRLVSLVGMTVCDNDSILLSDEPQRQQSTGKSILRSMGSILSKFKSHANTNGCEPTECEEYSDGEDVIILQKFKKSDIIAPRHQPINNYQFDKMDAVNNMPSANRPPPGLIPRKKWSRVPDLQKIVPQPRVNGHQYDCESSSIGNHVINGTTLSHNRHYIDSTSGNRYSNFINSAVRLDSIMCIVCVIWRVF